MTNGSEFERAIRGPSGFRGVYHVKDVAGLGMELPDLSFQTLRNLVDTKKSHLMIIDNDHPEERTMGWLLDELRKKERDHIINMLSYQFTDGSKLDSAVRTPDLVRRESLHLRLHEKLSTLGSAHDTFRSSLPNIDKYLIVSMKGAFTQCHMDLSGMPVFFHVARGKKVFYVAASSPANHKIYEDWMLADSSSAWIGAQHDELFSRVEINEGETVFLSSGHAHYVYTEEDSIVVTGSWISPDTLDIQFRLTRMDRELTCKGIVLPENTCIEFEEVIFSFCEHILLAEPQNGRSLSTHQVQEMITGLTPYTHSSSKTQHVSLKKRREILKSLLKLQETNASRSAGPCRKRSKL